MDATYLEACLKEGQIIRWPDTAMPIRVFVAPFRWYEKSKQMESYTYNQMVYDALEAWREGSDGMIRFQNVATINESQIDVSWRRINRVSLGHCTYMSNAESLLYSAEIQIGVSDGMFLAEYNSQDEVKHTILHEIGHALGLIGHSDGPDDIMYVPHQFGVTSLSPRDLHTLRTLYKLPPGFNPYSIGQKHQLKEPFSTQDVLNYLENPHGNPKRIDFLPQPLPENPAILTQQHDILSQMGRLQLATQNIRVSQDVKRMVINRQKNPPPTEPPQKTK